MKEFYTQTEVATACRVTSSAMKAWIQTGALSLPKAAHKGQQQIYQYTYEQLREHIVFAFLVKTEGYRPWGAARQFAKKGWKQIADEYGLDTSGH